MLQGEHSAHFRPSLTYYLSIIEIFVLSIFKWPLMTGFTVITSREVKRVDLTAQLDLHCFQNGIYAGLVYVYGSYYDLSEF